ncbi:MAG: DNA mismatch repair endonuclease MutL [Desulfamplus sp.]|nr:DNA mismatch repair endonuclease MutL [Desulfamplus sp.]
MPEVRILPEIIANKIAAGEVVERPASVVKELVENSLDAGAKHITVEVQNGGSDLIRVSDDGYGMSKQDALLALQRYATSKIASDDDLFSINTFGFRGEALPSIASVSQFSLTTKDAESQSATKIDINGGKVVNISEAGAPIGTMIEVKNLYFNTPARRKFLKTVNTEMGHIADTLSAFALCAPNVQFRLIHNGRNVKHFSISDDLLSRVGMVLNIDNLNYLYPLESANTIKNSRDIEISGYISSPDIFKNSSSNILIFVNRRLISDRAILSAVLKGYKERLVKGQFPMAVLFIEVAFDQVDVNVHPAKLQVRFANQSLVFGSVANAVHNALYIADSSLSSSVIYQEHKEKEKIAQIHESLNFTQAIERDIEFSEPKFQYIPPDEPKILNINPNSKQAIKQPIYVNCQTSKKIGDIRIIGQFKDSYIVAESIGQSDPNQLNQSYPQLILIDQHAAHERVVYEKLKKRSEGFKPPSQDLIVPVAIELNHKEMATLEGLIPQLATLGIEIEHFGGTTFIVKSVPAILGERSIKEIICDIVDMAMVEVSEASYKMGADIGKESVFDQNRDWLDKILITMACHSAVRANHQLNQKEMEQLIVELDQCDNPYNCPHGRPTIISFSEQELKKRFKRIV